MTDNNNNVLDKLTEVKLKEDDSGNTNFLVVRETLQRIGVGNKDKQLFQSCHLLQKRGKFYVVHFKKLFELDGKPSTLSEEDLARENTIINLLRDWNLIDIVDPERTKSPTVPIQKIKIISYGDKNEWELIEKYSIGNKKKKEDSNA